MRQLSRRLHMPMVVADATFAEAGSPPPPDTKKGGAGPRAEAVAAAKPAPARKRLQSNAAKAEAAAAAAAAAATPPGATPSSSLVAVAASQTMPKIEPVSSAAITSSSALSAITQPQAASGAAQRRGSTPTPAASHHVHIKGGFRRRSEIDRRLESLIGPSGRLKDASRQNIINVGVGAGHQSTCGACALCLGCCQWPVWVSQLHHKGLALHLSLVAVLSCPAHLQVLRMFNLCDIGPNRNAAVRPVPAEATPANEPGAAESARPGSGSDQETVTHAGAHGPAGPAVTTAGTEAEAGASTAVKEEASAVQLPGPPGQPPSEATKDDAAGPGPGSTPAPPVNQPFRGILAAMRAGAPLPGPPSKPVPQAQQQQDSQQAHLLQRPPGVITARQRARMADLSLLLDVILKTGSATVKKEFVTCGVLNQLFQVRSVEKTPCTLHSPSGQPSRLLSIQPHFLIPLPHLYMFP